MSDKERLVLEIEVPGFNVDGAQEMADEFCEGDVLTLLTEHWMRRDVVLALVSLPAEKELESDFELHGMEGRIIGARIDCGRGRRRRSREVDELDRDNDATVEHAGEQT